MKTAGSRASPFVIEDSRACDAPPDVAMSLVLDPTTRPSWQPEILDAVGPERPVAGDRIEGRARMLGFVVEGRSLITESTSTSFIEDVVVGVRMRVRYEVRPTATGSIIVHRLECDLPGGVSGAILSMFLRRRLRRMQRDTLVNLARQADSVS